MKPPVTPAGTASEDVVESGSGLVSVSTCSFDHLVLRQSAQIVSSDTLKGQERLFYAHLAAG